MYHNDHIAHGPLARDVHDGADDLTDRPAHSRAGRLRTRRQRLRRMGVALLVTAFVVVAVAVAAKAVAGRSNKAHRQTSTKTPAIAPKQGPAALPPAAQCTTYVAPRGSDGAAGTISRPFATITHAAAAAIRSNVVCIRAGTYHEVIHVLRSGVTVQSFPGERAVIDGTGVSLAPTDGLLQIAGRTNGVTVRDLTIQNSMGRGITNGGSRNRVLDTTITNTQNAGLLTTNLDGPTVENQYIGNDISRTVQSNDCHTPTDVCKRAGGWESAVNAYDSGTSATGRNVYLQNHIHDNDGEGITPVDGDVVRGNTLNDNFAAEIYVDRKRNVLIEDNLLYESETNYLPVTQNQSYRLLARGIGLADEFLPARTAGTVIRNNFMINVREGIYFWRATPGSGVIDTTIDNNTIVNTWDYGMDFDASSVSRHDVIRDNIVVPRRGGTTKGVEGVPGIQTVANLFVQKGSHGDPYIVGEGSFSFDPADYALQSTSVSAIDAGVPTSARQDYFGTARPQGVAFDIGADEFH